MRKTWTESDAQQLKTLREQAGIPQAAFAKRHALSVAQVRELEGGKTGSFYSEDIKAHTGRRLVGHRRLVLRRLAGTGGLAAGGQGGLVRARHDDRRSGGG